MRPISSSSQGFTLIELSLVLVIIGLIVGGVLVGQDLIAAATIRAQVSQIEKYHTAVHTFQTKYNCLPGDCASAYANGTVLGARGLFAGEGDGNELIEGIYANIASANYGAQQGAGETAIFWVDLSSANLIDQTFTKASETVVPGGAITGTAISGYMPLAKLGSGNYVYVFSVTGTVGVYGNFNYFGISDVTGIWTPLAGEMISNAGVTVQQAFSIDTKIDDGFPQSGHVTSAFVNAGVWGWGSQSYGTGATQGNATTCFDNNNTNGATQFYSMEINHGSGINCGLSIQFQ